MTPIQQMFLGLGAADKVYLDNVFSTYLYKGNNSTQTITNGLDLASDGGMIWVKNRDSSRDHCIVDTVRGIGKRIEPNKSDAQDVYVTSKNISSFTSTGFTLGQDEGHDEFNANGDDYSSWNFKKQKGFFTIKEYSGSSSNQTLSHDLGCIPGLIIVKRTDSTGDWMVYHTSLGAANYAKLNTTVAGGAGSVWNSTSPTSTTFTVEGNNGFVNTSGGTFIAYLFAGGESTAATARSVEFHGGDDSLVIYNQADLSPEAGDFTCEMWIKPDSWSSGDTLVYASSSGFSIKRDGSNNTLIIGMAGSTTHLTSTSLPDTGVWTHIAVARSSGTMRLFFNGILNKEATVTHSYASPVTMYIVGGGGEFNGKISNFRFVKGTAVYTSSFKVPTEPLTNITNTKLLCCNDSSVTGSTVTPGTVTSGGPPDASADSPFDDPAGYKFGEGADQNIIKTGYHTHATTDSVRIYTGWEPQWIMCKNATQASNWAMFDVMRGIFIGTDGPSLAADSDAAENGVVGQGQIIIPHGDGFTIKYGLTAANPGNGDTIIYMAIRRSDGTTAPEPTAGTNVFNVVLGAGNASIPDFAANFAVDMGIVRQFANTQNNYIASRLTGTKYLQTNNKVEESTAASFVWDSNVGWNSNSNNTNISWMWKRGLGMDTVVFTGDSVQGRDIRHNLGVAPDMMWFKNRTRSLGGGADWIAYISGITHLSVYGSDPDNYGNNPVAFELNNTEKAQFSASGYWDHTHPTSTHFRVGDTYHTNQSGESIIAYLFASRAGISKVGSYSGSNSDQTITLGFQPRFFLCKSSNTQGTGFSWNVFDSVRGISGSSTKRLWYDLDTTQGSGSYVTSVSSTGITLAGDYSHSNQASRNYIYYAHA